MFTDLSLQVALGRVPCSQTTFRHPSGLGVMGNYNSQTLLYRPPYWVKIYVGSVFSLPLQVYIVR